MAALIKKKKERDAKIPDAGMSDIVFLLLLFFLVSTTIDVDTGIGITLPEKIEDTEVTPLPKDRMANILINENGDVLYNKEQISIPQVREKLAVRIREKIELPSTKKLVVSIKTDRKTNYNLFIECFDMCKLAFRDVRNELSQQLYNISYDDMVRDTKSQMDNDERIKNIKAKIPEIISFAEPEKIK